ncbi:hypothetical protein IB234_10830 [Pseudomonas sp. PDM16]|uniref:hypothetical protein n=1 Tax=Pseudomonas sp. PDM16 TaxID=2769292 RepID=UPI001784DE18|nr:hypothetical protein [Pseudomonas sp. PDM16]MBD9415054.1 hypothetical protein [Pseudomonas sp. PDM16]
MLSKPADVQCMLDERAAAFRDIQAFLRDSGPIDSEYKQREFDRLRERAEAIVAALGESLAA